MISIVLAHECFTRVDQIPDETSKTFVYRDHNILEGDMMYVVNSLAKNGTTSMPKITIIIPIYNVEKYLTQCIYSVLSQSYKNIEIILVDDGSFDNSGHMCDEIARKDDRIIVIHQGNGGLSHARNTGIKMASGDYIMFLDSDDYWRGNDSLEKLVICLNESKADVLVFGRDLYYENTKSTRVKSPICDREYVLTSTKEKAFDYLVDKGIFISSSCNKVVKRNLIVENNIFFRKGVTSEDIEWSARIAIASTKLDYYPRNIYIYRQREGSITKTVKYENVQLLKENIEHCIFHAEKIIDTLFFNSIMGYIAYQYIILLACSLKLTLNEKKTLIDKIRKDSYLLNYGTNPKVKLVRITKLVLGFKGMYFLLNLFFTLRGRKNV